MKQSASRRNNTRRKNARITPISRYRDTNEDDTVADTAANNDDRLSTRIEFDNEHYEIVNLRATKPLLQHNSITVFKNKVDNKNIIHIRCILLCSQLSLHTVISAI